MVAVIVIVALVIFAAGVTAGTIAIVSWGIRREERDFSLTRQAPGRASQGVRLLTGLYVRRRTDTDPDTIQRPDIYA